MASLVIPVTPVMRTDACMASLVNLVHLLRCAQAVADPTFLEMETKKQMAERQVRLFSHARMRSQIMMTMHSAFPLLCQAWQYISTVQWT
eukprot:1150776-Pelagomonas_calceolata.AAC.5